MKVVTLVFVVLILCLVGFSGCHKTENAWGTDSDIYTDTDSDTDTDTDSDTATGTDTDTVTDTQTDSDDCDPGYSWPYDKAATGAQGGETGFDHLFLPPDPVCLPRDVSLYQVRSKVGGYHWGFYDDFVRPKALEYLDPSCVTDCENMSNFDACEVADCTTAEGTIIEYRRTMISELNFEQKFSTTRIEETLVIGLPEGVESWSRIELQISYYDYVTPYGENSESQYSAKWDGSLHPVLPDDYAVTATMNYDDETGYYNGLNGHWTFSHEALHLEVYNSPDPGGYNLLYRVVINDTVVEISGSWFQTWYAWIDNECIGEVSNLWQPNDPFNSNWEIIGECP